MKYEIHTCPDRLWYVEEFMIPAMTAQGISRSDILVLNDREHRGVLEMTMLSFAFQSENCWHLQDDVLISSRFAQVTAQAHNKIICGYCSAYIQGKPSGETNIQNIWYSFPCIYIPKQYAHEVAAWYHIYAERDPQYADWVKAGKHVDEFFKIYLKETYPRMKVINLAPNIVEHVDWLIGGSTINPDKQGLRRSKYWDEPELVTELEKKLKERADA